MKIQHLVSTPKLIEIVLDNEDIIKNHGEPITFYAYDIVSMTTYFDFFTARSQSEYEMLTTLVRKLILDDAGKPVMTESQELPIDVMAAAVTKIGELLGKSSGKTSTQSNGTVQD
jgi:hypothetical protein